MLRGHRAGTPAQAKIPRKKVEVGGREVGVKIKAPTLVRDHGSISVQLNFHRRDSGLVCVAPAVPLRLTEGKVIATSVDSLVQQIF